MNRMLQEGLSEVVSKTPLHWMVRQVKNTLADIKNKHGVDQKYLQRFNPKTPWIYGLPIIHKPRNKLRPIRRTSTHQQNA
jgi:hypothetical protein